MEKVAQRKPASSSNSTNKDLAEGYNAFKEFEGRKYTGMKVGGRHTWHYDQGEWKETKVTPDKWQFSYDVNKRRKGHAPEGSGVPVGTEYHWYILADQTVKKLNANEYTTSMSGTKYKLAHRRADSEKWSASDRAQARHLIRIFEENITHLQQTLVEEEKKTESQGAQPIAHAVPRKRQRETGSGRKAAVLENPPLASR